VQYGFNGRGQILDGTAYHGILPRGYDRTERMDPVVRYYTIINKKRNNQQFKYFYIM